jgi:predicted Zn-dependent peptidase
MNKLTVFTEKGIPHKYFNCVLFFSVGSVNETENNNGISHFLEHLIFHLPVKNGKTIFEQLEAHGINFNATTSIEFTRYYFFGPATKIDVVVEILRLILYAGINEIRDLENEFQKEKNIVIQELCIGSESLSSNLSQYILHKTKVFTPIGTIRNILDRMPIEDLHKYKKRFYCVDNAHLFLHASDYKITDLFVEKLFRVIPELKKKGDLVSNNLYQMIHKKSLVALSGASKSRITTTTKTVPLITLSFTEVLRNTFPNEYIGAEVAYKPFYFVHCTPTELLLYYNTDVSHDKIFTVTSTDKTTVSVDTKALVNTNGRYCNFNGDLFRPLSTYFLFQIAIDIGKLFQLEDTKDHSVVSKDFYALFTMLVIKNIFKSSLREKHHLVYALRGGSHYFKQFKTYYVSGRSNSLQHLKDIFAFVIADIIDSKTRNDKLIRGAYKKSLETFKNDIVTSDDVLLTSLEDEYHNLVYGAPPATVPKPSALSAINCVSLKKELYDENKFKIESFDSVYEDLSELFSPKNIVFIYYGTK